MAGSTPEGIKKHRMDEMGAVKIFCHTEPREGGRKICPGDTSLEILTAQ